MTLEIDDKIPCKTCITQAVCRGSSLKHIISKCELVTEYIYPNKQTSSPIKHELKIDAYIVTVAMDKLEYLCNFLELKDLES